MVSKLFRAVIVFSILLAGCRNSDRSNEKTTNKNAFGNDLAFLEKRDKGLVVLSAEEGNARVVISPKYQGKVFTSTAEGDGGKSFGWINYSAFDKDADPHMNAYGGEDRLWTGSGRRPLLSVLCPR